MYESLRINIYYRDSLIILNQAFQIQDIFKSETNLKKKSKCVRVEYPSSFNNATKDDFVHVGKGRKEITN